MIIPTIIKSVINLVDKKKKKKVSKLSNHDIFNTLIRVKNEVANMKFYTHGKYDKVKSKMCFDFTKYKTEICRDRMESFLKTINIDKINKDKLKRIILEEQNLMHEEYIRAIIKDWSYKGIGQTDIDYIIQFFLIYLY